ncbi:hypothetical protein GH5_06137 [Leishmania sp. Ghana 2012 LV757]|uniref:hypothetical protein n=1 Tax=Leishmania sp. Ghana 2012 LV757 TaxID=2803181 RepID=UPI001B70DB9C|nr:hypothetical protein GH5_06137 [Leishmania sp. Ghana 2012 LV757]
MLCLRLFLLIFAICFTACVTCSILFPLFRLEITLEELNKTRLTVYYWYNETVSSVDGGSLIFRYYARDFTCTNQRIAHIAMSVLSVVAASMGGIAVLFLACWTLAGPHCCLGIIAYFAIFVAFVCSLVTLALSGYVYVTDFCGGDSLRKAQYKLVEGFALICIATGGYLILLFLGLIVLCCCCRAASLSDIGAYHYHK